MSTLIWMAIISLALLAIGVVRDFVAWVFGQLWKLLLWVSGVALVVAQHIARAVFDAHLTIIKNLLPRQTVLPSVRVKSVKRTD